MRKKSKNFGLAKAWQRLIKKSDKIRRQRMSFKMLQCIHALELRSKAKYDIGTFYISKVNGQRASKVKDLPEGKYREIQYLRDQETRKLLGKLNDFMQRIIPIYFENPIHDQHGFLKGESVENNVASIQTQAKGNAILLCDMSNAFCSITENEVFQLFYRVFKLNRKDSEMLTKLVTYNGHLYQGSPLSPLIFDLYENAVIEDIQGLGMGVSAYADDITVIDKKYNSMSWSMRKKIYKIFRDYHLSINEDKTRFSNNRHKQDCVTGFHINDCNTKKRHAMKKRCRALEYQLGLEYNTQFKGLNLVKLLNYGSNEKDTRLQQLLGCRLWMSHSNFVINLIT